MIDILIRENYAIAVEVETNDLIRTAMRFISCSVNLTDKGLNCYDKVLAIIFEYFRLVREEWLADGKEVIFFEEMCRANKLAFDVYI